MAKGTTSANPRRRGKKELGNELDVKQIRIQPKIWSVEAKAGRGTL